MLVSKINFFLFKSLQVTQERYYLILLSFALEETVICNIGSSHSGFPV